MLPVFLWWWRLSRKKLCSDSFWSYMLWGEAWVKRQRSAEFDKGKVSKGTACGRVNNYSFWGLSWKKEKKDKRVWNLRLSLVFLVSLVLLWRQSLSNNNKRRDVHKALQVFLVCSLVWLAALPFLMTTPPFFVFMTTPPFFADVH